ncbi:MAG: hypothetical protein IPJ27_11170 [Candidatus Accumulibacter sp.]|uniref:DUF4129 domain-containing protein n=1 Tax=Candidatus Accumulibacter proximus TaxID=2954385 RepID=A0A935UFQ6_9PROT|nr:hypothetical protein [Candidatus Accumulibacter proximus]
MRRFLIPLVLAAGGLGAAESPPGEPAPPPAAAAIHDIRGPVAVDSLPPFALTGGALVLAGGVFWLQRKWRRRPAAVRSPGADSRPAASTVLARLAADYRRGACSSSQLIVCLDDLLRSTLADHTGIAAQRLTSSELLLQAAAFLDDQQRDWLKQLVALCDRVKFAAHQPDASEIDGALSSAASLLECSSAGPA